METPNTAFYLPTLVRDFDEDDVTLKVVPVNANGVRGEGTELIIDWLYSNEDSEVYEPKEFENVCLGATVTGYSGQNESEPASKAIDGTSLNGSKWCVTNAETGYMDIDIGRKVTVRRWRVEHAQYGGEDVLMNTVDFALEYKNASGWWVEAKRIPDSDKSLNYLVGMIYTQLIQTLYRQADRVHKGRLPVPVHCLMDEYANISLPKDTFLSALATMRSRAIFCSIIVQNMAQLKAMYKDDWESLVGLCDEFLYLGGTEKETHKYVSELLGKETISTTSYNQSKGRSGSYSINRQQSGRDLMTPDEVRLLDNSKCILFIRGERPVIDLKYNLLKHPNIRYTEDGGAAPYDYTAAYNALDDLPGAPENYELLDMDDFLPAEAAEMKPTIQRIRRPK